MAQAGELRARRLYFRRPQYLPQNRRRGGVRRVGRGRRSGQPAPPAAVRLRPPGRPVAVPLAQLPGAAAGGGTRARHARVRAPRGGAVQARAGPAARRLHRRRLPARPQPRPQPLARAPRLPRRALRRVRHRATAPPAGLHPRPPPSHRRGRRRWRRGLRAVLVPQLLAVLRQLRRARRAPADLEPRRRWFPDVRVERRQRRWRGAAGGVWHGGRRRRRGRGGGRRLAARLQRALRRRLRGQHPTLQHVRLPHDHHQRLHSAGSMELRKQMPATAFGGCQPLSHGRGGGPVGRGLLQGLPVKRARVAARARARARLVRAGAALCARARRLHSLRLQTEERDGGQAAGYDVHELPHDDHVAVAPQLARRDRLQRLRPLLQAAQRQPPARHEEGRHTDEKEETKERYESGPESENSRSAHAHVWCQDGKLNGGERRGLLRAARAEAGGAAAGARARALRRARLPPRARRRRLHGQLSAPAASAALIIM